MTAGFLTCEAQHAMQRTGAILKNLAAASVLLVVQGCGFLPATPQPAPQADTPPQPSAQKSNAIAKTKVEQPRVKKTTATAPASNRVKPEDKQTRNVVCWARATLYPTRTTQTLEIVTRDAVNDIQVRPALLRHQQRQYVEREGAKSYRVQPPSYKQIHEHVQVRPEVRRSIVVPAVFDTKEERIEVESERIIQTPCLMPGDKKSKASTRQSLCTKVQPARYKTLKRKILVSPETVREEIEPAVYKTITRWVVDQPARAIETEIPEETASYEVQYIAKTEQIKERQIPPHIVNIEHVRHDGKTISVWRQAPCSDQLDEALIRQLQNALNAAGQASGTPDGKFGKKTLQAVQSYQLKHGLASGALTLETLQHLGILEK